jgi:hypothetical protein
VTLDLWDVCYTDGGFGKHGKGPFTTQAKAAASLRAVGWPGRVECVRVTMDRKRAEWDYPTVHLVNMAEQVRIVWPSDRDAPLMWAEGPEWRTDFFVDAPFAGEKLAGVSFTRWHSALTAAMHWAYEPASMPPAGWKVAT